MSKLTEELRTKAIFNPHDFAYAHGALNDNYPGDRPRRPKIEGLPYPIPILQYYKEQPGRAYRPARWVFRQAGVDLDPGCHWQDRGTKTWDMFRAEGNTPAARKKFVFEQALAWAHERWGLTEWAREPYGSWMPATFVKARLAQLKAYQP